MPTTHPHHTPVRVTAWPHITVGGHPATITGMDRVRPSAAVWRVSYPDGRTDRVGPVSAVADDGRVS